MIKVDASLANGIKNWLDQLSWNGVSVPGILQTPFVLPCGGILNNRLVKSATQEALGDERCLPSEELLYLYRRWSEGGAGLLITGDVMIDYAHMERPGNIVIEGREGLADLKQWATAGSVAGNQFWIQINHPGRQTPLPFNPNPLAPSATVEGLPPRAFGMPRAMVEQEIHDVIKRFATTAAIAREAGFTGIQLHAAHGFLISQFLSPLANQRHDDWGGSLENRARLLLDSIAAIRTKVGNDFPISVKLNSADFQRGGFDIEECVGVVAMLNESTLDLLEISGGNVASLAMMGNPEVAGAETLKAQSTVRREAYFADYARRIRPVATMPMMITGGFRTLDAMVDILEQDLTHLIGMARPLCVDPEICAKLLDGRVSAAPTIQEELTLDRFTLPDGSDDTAFNYAVSAAQLAWLYLQVARLGRGENPDVTLPIDNAVAELTRLDETRAPLRMMLGV